MQIDRRRDGGRVSDRSASKTNDGRVAKFAANFDFGWKSDKFERFHKFCPRHLQWRYLFGNESIRRF